MGGGSSSSSGAAKVEELSGVAPYGGFAAPTDAWGGPLSSPPRRTSATGSAEGSYLIISHN